MSKSSAKQKYVQLTSWLETFKKTSSGKVKTQKRDSRLDYYKTKE